MKRKRKGTKGTGGADLLSVPGMETLDTLTRKVLEVPKEEIDRREAEYKAGRTEKPSGTQGN